MANLMKAAIARSFAQPLSIEEIPIPEINADQVLIKLHACGVCHTDIHAVDGDWPVKPVLPFIPGHEAVGEVAAIGAAVTHLKEGDRVGVPWLYSSCGYCEYCVTGWEPLCDKQQNTGYSVNGGYAEYIVANPYYVIRLPDKLNLAAAAPVLCAGLTVYKGIKETECQTGDWLAVSGIGGLGHMAVQYAKAMGLHVAAIDVDDTKLQLARQFKADLLVNAKHEDPVIKILKETGGVHGAIVTSISLSSFPQALAMLRKLGTAVLVGLPPGEFSIPLFDMVANQKTVRGSIVGNRIELAECLAIAAENKVMAHYSLEPLDKVNEVFARLKQGKITGRMVLKIS